MPERTSVDPARSVTLLFTALLAAILALLNISAGFNALVLAMQWLPLALTVPGLLRGNVRSAQWLCFLTLFFLVHGILRAFTPGGLLAGIAESLICLGLFVSAIIFIRSSRRPAA